MSLSIVKVNRLPNDTAFRSRTSKRFSKASPPEPVNFEFDDIAIPPRTSDELSLEKVNSSLRRTRTAIRDIVISYKNFPP